MNTENDTQTPMSSEQIEAAIAALLAEKGITFAAQHVALIAKPQGNEKPWQCDQWRIVFARVGHIPATQIREYVTDYFTGTGHREVPKNQKSFMARELKNYHHSRHAEIRARYAKPVAPKAASVLHSLCIDAQAGNESFANWCDNFGFDADSIKALNTYQACEKTARAMLAFFGRDIVRQFETITQDY